MWTMRPLPAAEAYEKQAEVEKQQLLARCPQAEQTPSWQPARQAPEPNAQKRSCRKPMPRPHGTGPCDVREAAGRNLTAQDDARLLDDALEKAGATWQLNSVVNFFADNRIVKAELRSAASPGRLNPDAPKYASCMSTTESS